MDNKDNKNKWIITEKEKEQFIESLTNALSALRATADIPQDELAKLICISRQTYGSIERKQRKMSWNTYLALILFFDYTTATHNMLRNLSAFPSSLINRFNKDKNNNEITNLDIEKITGLPIESLKEKLDERAIHAIKTVIILEHARCNKITDTKILKSLDNLNFLNRDLNK